MKALQGGLFVLIGLGILWLAVTGRLDRLFQAWEYIWSGTHGLPGMTPSQSPVQPRRSPVVLSSNTFAGLPATLQRAFV